MNKRALLAALLIVIAAPLYADFRSIERALTARLGSPTYIPLLGLVRVATWVARPEGVHDFQLAVYEGPRRGIDGVEMERIVAREIPAGFSPLVRARSRNGEWTFIYARPAGDRVEMFIVAHDRSDTTLVRVDIDAVRVAKKIGDARAMKKIAER